MKDNDIIIRRAETRDIPKILDLLLQVLTVHADGRPDIFRHNATKYNAEELGDILRDESRPVFAAEKDGTVCGYAFCILKCPTESSVLKPVRTLYIDDLCVDENMRGCGIGTRLFGYVKRFASEQGCYNITLNVWSCNKNALRFYESMGMTTQCEHKEYIL